MLRPPLPGELWRINALEAHCLMDALDRFQDFFHEELLLWYWIQQLTLEAARYDPTIELSSQPAILITPLDKDGEFFERLVAKEREHLAFHDSTYVLLCGHEVREHEIVLSDWAEREIETAKKFASSREALSQASIETKLFGSGLSLSREDAEREIEKGVARYIIDRKIRDAESLRDLESEEGQRLRQEAGLPPYNREETIARLNHACQVGAEDARTQLRQIMEKYIIKE